MPRRQGDTFCRPGKRKKRRLLKKLQVDRKSFLAENDKGSYYQWPNEETRESAKEEIGSSAKKLLNESAENVDECPTGARDDVLQKPTQLTLVDPNSLETGIIIQLCARNVVTLSSC